ncbi:hypothetical protein [Janibacter melonis]|uniref:hypothetical protein n=1 Tax=Janibacter melonis TaxID=262209 RepID=UPI00174B253A|nr:hypothetical protein [Janibacter melonis]
MEVPGKRADREVLTMSEELAERGEVLIGTTTYEPSVQEAEAMLQAVRKRADGWRNGVGATLTLVLASLAVKPGEGFMKYTGDTRVALMLLIGGSLVSALVALFLLVNAANGPTWLRELVGHEATPQRYLRRVVGARRDLRVGQGLWVVSLLLFCGAVLATWLTPLP